MLVLSRKKHEAIVFSTPQGEVIVEVVEVKGDKVRLGIKCDKDIPVHRKETFDAIQREIDDKDNYIKRMTERLPPVEEPTSQTSEATLFSLNEDMEMEGKSHLELLKESIEKLNRVAKCIVEIHVDDESATVTTDDGVTKQDWRIKFTKISNFDALGDDEDGCGPDGSYVDQ
jgi:carbon storage regulator